MSDNQQVDIFADQPQHRHFAELCNALYERELQALSQASFNNMRLLQRRLSGLSYHIKRAAEFLLSNPTPINVDIHNGSWQSKQAAKCVMSRVTAEKNTQWFTQHAKFGIAVPVYVMQLGIEHLELDSIDRIDTDKKRIHVNKHGWFTFSGEHIFVDATSPPSNQKRLLLPNKTTCAAACCGHSWNHRGRSQPRAITLRELLLSTTIDWKTFR